MRIKQLTVLAIAYSTLATNFHLQGSGTRYQQPLYNRAVAFYTYGNHTPAGPSKNTFNPPGIEGLRQAQNLQSKVQGNRNDRRSGETAFSLIGVPASVDGISCIQPGKPFFDQVLLQL